MNASQNSSVSTGIGIVSLLGILGLLGILYSEILVGLVFDWENDPNYSHGFIVPFISAYLIWERWGVLKTVPLQPNPWGALFLMIGLAILVVGSIGAELYTQRFSLIVVLSGLVLLILGKQLMMHLSLPLAFLIFMVPLPAIVVNTIAFPLQLLAAQTAAFCLFQAKHGSLDRQAGHSFHSVHCLQLDHCPAGLCHGIYPATIIPTAKTRPFCLASGNIWLLRSEPGAFDQPLAG